MFVLFAGREDEAIRVGAKGNHYIIRTINEARILSGSKLKPIICEVGIYLIRISCVASVVVTSINQVPFPAAPRSLSRGRNGIIIVVPRCRALGPPRVFFFFFFFMHRACARETYETCASVYSRV